MLWQHFYWVLLGLDKKTLVYFISIIFLKWLFNYRVFIIKKSNEKGETNNKVNY